MLRAIPIAQYCCILQLSWLKLLSFKFILGLIRQLRLAVTSQDAGSRELLF